MCETEKLMHDHESYTELTLKKRNLYTLESNSCRRIPFEKNSKQAYSGYEFCHNKCFVAA